MLVEFQVANFGSFKDPASLNMQSSREQRFRDRVPRLEQTYRMSVNPIAAIYGANASGKSNLLQALRMLRSMVLGTRSVDRQRDYLFMLDPNMLDEPTLFKLVFTVNDTMYSYFLAIRHGHVLEEYLAKLTATQETIFFDRQENKVNFGSPWQDNPLINELATTVQKDVTLAGRLAPAEVPGAVVHEPRGLSNAVGRSVGMLLRDPSTPGSAFWQSYVRTVTDMPWAVRGAAILEAGLGGALVGVAVRRHHRNGRLPGGLLGVGIVLMADAIAETSLASWTRHRELRRRADEEMALVAEEGLGLADAGARLSVSQDAQDVGVYALPGSIVTCDGQATLTTERPWGVLVTADGVIGPAEGEADVDLTDMLDLAQAMGPRPGL